MANYMGCSMCIFGQSVINGITCKTNERSFDVYKKKNTHLLKASVDDGNFEGSIGLSLASMNIFLVSKIDEIFIFESDNFNFIEKIPI